VRLLTETSFEMKFYEPHRALEEARATSHRPTPGMSTHATSKAALRGDPIRRRFRSFTASSLASTGRVSLRRELYANLAGPLRANRGTTSPGRSWTDRPTTTPICRGPPRRRGLRQRRRRHGEPVPQGRPAGAADHVDAINPLLEARANRSR
jgi:hypothetical protein